MARIHLDFLSGTIADNPLLVGATTLNSTALAAVGAVVAPDYLPIVLDPDGVSGTPEIVYVTAHTAGTGVATISRGKEGTSARQHFANEAWRHAPTVLDFDAGSPGVIYVAETGSDSNDGVTWGAAKASVQAALDALPGGGVVFVGYGTFPSSSPIIYSSGQSIIGCGAAVEGLANSSLVTKLVYTGTGDAIKGDLGQAGYISSVVLEGFSIDTNGTANTAASAIHVWNGHDMTIRNVVIGGQFTDGILLDSSAINGDNVTIENVRIEPFLGGRVITRGIRVPPSPAQYNQVVLDRVLINVGDASGTVGGRGDTCFRVDGTLLNAALLNVGFLCATYGFATYGAGQAAGVTIIAPHFEAAILNQYNLVNSNDQVMSFGGPGSGVGAVGAFPNQGLLVRSDGRVTTGRNDRVGLHVARNATGQTADIFRVEKEDFSAVMAVGAKGQLLVQPDDTANPSLWVIGPASAAGSLAEFRTSGGTTLKIGANASLSHPNTPLGFFGATPASKPTVTGSKGGNAALASLLTALAGLGLITDSST